MNRNQEREHKQSNKGQTPGRQDNDNRSAQDQAANRGPENRTEKRPVSGGNR